MKENAHTTIEIDKLAIRRNVMTIGVLVRDTSGHPEDLELKLAVVFSNGRETRILPLPVTASNYDEHGNVICYAILDYELDCLFGNKDLNEFYVDVQVYNGTEYERIFVKDASFSQVKDENEYALFVEEGRIVIRRKKKVKPFVKNPILRFFGMLFRFVEILIGTLLLPVFLLDGIYVVYMGNSRWMEEETFGGSQLKRALLFAKWRYSAFCRWSATASMIKGFVLNVAASFFSLFTRGKAILFVSSRRGDLTGNIAYVNEELKAKNVKVLFWLEPGKVKYIKWSKIFDLALKIAKSQVVVVDDFTPILNDIGALKKRKLIQLWHACGAFKTFGFSRIGKDGGPNQTSRNHRNYDYAMVSSSEIRRFYAEGFGIDVEHVLPLGVPRTDDFFKEEYKTTIREKLYGDYPILKGKKVVMFAPTFRGNGAESAFYPFEKFPVEQVVKALGEDYVLIVKHHPFVTEKHPIPEAVKNQVLDLSKESEINDLLFVTDLLITDYSSVIFEASLLDIPMLFYAFDLEEYVVTRDFYYPFKDFVPGKIVRSIEDITEAVEQKDYEQEKVSAFKHRFFDDLDGKASLRIADFMVSLVGK